MTGEKSYHGYNHMMAGGVAGSFAVLLLHPFDVIKTRLQVQDGAGVALPQYKGPIDAIRTIMRTEGWRSFYKGLTPALIGSGVAWAAYFYVYEAVKGWHCRWQGKERLSTGWNMLSAAQAGATVCLMTNPIWLIKTRLQLQRAQPLASAAAAAASQLAGAAAPAVRPTPLQYRGFLDALMRIGREEGIRGYYKGLGPSLVLQTTHGALQFAVYEELKHFGARLNMEPDEPDRQVTTAELSLFAASSKLTASVSTYPSQVIRSRIQQRMDDGRTLVYRSTREAVRLTWQREGFVGFYKGLGPALARVMPQSALTLVLYENVLRLLNAASEADAAAAASASSAGAS